MRPLAGFISPAWISRSGHRVLAVARQEFLSLTRSGAYRAGCFFLLSLLLFAGSVGGRYQERVKVELSSLQTKVTQQWLAQPDRHPHRVSHFGSYAFREPSLMSWLDTGLGSFVGNSIFLEPHRQNSANFSQSRHSGSLLRFGELSVSQVLKLLLPLFIIFWSFASVAAERQSGTLRLLLSQGVSGGELLLGKALGIYTAVIVPLLPLALGAGWLLQEQGIRYLIWLWSFALYAWIWVGLSLLLSASLLSPATVLVALLGLWSFSTILMPRFAPSLAQSLWPAPSRGVFEAQISLAILQEADGHHHDDDRFKERKQAMLQRFGAKSVEALPVNFQGIAMREGEHKSAAIYQEHFQRLWTTYRQQNDFVEACGWLNPYFAIHFFSMALAGSDMEHFVDFQNQAEEHRFAFVDRLNQLHTHKIRFHNDRQQKLDSLTWKAFAPFHYQQPSLAWALQAHHKSLVALSLWSLLLALGLSRFGWKEV